MLIYNEDLYTFVHYNVTHKYANFEVSAAVWLIIQFCSDTNPRHQVIGSWRCRTKQWSHIQRSKPYLRIRPLKIRTFLCPETSGTAYPVKWRHFPLKTEFSNKMYFEYRQVPCVMWDLKLCVMLQYHIVWSCLCYIVGQVTGKWSTDKVRNDSRRLASRISSAFHRFSLSLLRTHEHNLHLPYVGKTGGNSNRACMWSWTVYFTEIYRWFNRAKLLNYTKRLHKSYIHGPAIGLGILEFSGETSPLFSIINRIYTYIQFHSLTKLFIT
jgi:hypothetical protein